MKEAGSTFEWNGLVTALQSWLESRMRFLLLIRVLKLRWTVSDGPI